MGQLHGGTIGRRGPPRPRSHPRDVQAILAAQEALTAHTLAAAALRRIAFEGRDLHRRLAGSRKRAEGRRDRHHHSVDGGLDHPETEGLGAGVELHPRHAAGRAPLRANLRGGGTQQLRIRGHEHEVCRVGALIEAHEAIAVLQGDDLPLVALEHIGTQALDRASCCAHRNHGLALRIQQTNGGNVRV